MGLAQFQRRLAKLSKNVSAPGVIIIIITIIIGIKILIIMKILIIIKIKVIKKRRKKQ